MVTSHEKAGVISGKGRNVTYQGGLSGGGEHEGWRRRGGWLHSHFLSCQPVGYLSTAPASEALMGEQAVFSVYQRCKTRKFPWVLVKWAGPAVEN